MADAVQDVEVFQIQQQIRIHMPQDVDLYRPP
jgi:hypothetical protein